MDAWLILLKEEGYNLYEYGRKESILHAIPQREECYQRSESPLILGSIWHEVHYFCTESHGLSIELVVSDILHWFRWGAFDLLIFCDLGTPGICGGCVTTGKWIFGYKTKEYYCSKCSCREFDLCQECYNWYTERNTWGGNFVRSCASSGVEGGEHSYILYESKAPLSEPTTPTGEELAHRISLKIQVLTFKLFTRLFSICHSAGNLSTLARWTLESIVSERWIHVFVFIASSYFLKTTSIFMAIVAGKPLQWYMAAERRGSGRPNRRNS